MDGDDMFAAESKYAALTALVAFLKDKDWMRQVEAEFARAGEVLSEEGEETLVFVYSFSRGSGVV